MKTITREAIFAALKLTLLRVLEINEKPVEGDILESTNPVRDLGVETDDRIYVGCELSEILGVDIPEEAIHWVDDSTGERRNLPVREVVDHILEYLAAHPEGAVR